MCLWATRVPTLRNDETGLLVLAVIAAGRRILVAPHALDVLFDDRPAARLPQPVPRGEVGEVLLVLRRRDVDHVRIGELAADLDAIVGAIVAPRANLVAGVRPAAVSAARAGVGSADSAAAVWIGGGRNDASVEAAVESEGAARPDGARSGVAIRGAGAIAVAAAVFLAVCVAEADPVTFLGSMQAVARDDFPCLSGRRLQEED